MQLRNRGMTQEQAINLLQEHNKKYGNIFTFVRFIEQDQDGAIVLCKTSDGDEVEVGVYPDMVMPLPE